MYLLSPPLYPHPSTRPSFTLFFNFSPTHENIQCLSFGSGRDMFRQSILPESLLILSLYVLRSLTITVNAAFHRSASKCTTTLADIGDTIPLPSMAPLESLESRSSRVVGNYLLQSTNHSEKVQPRMRQVGRGIAKKGMMGTYQTCFCWSNHRAKTGSPKGRTKLFSSHSLLRWQSKPWPRHLRLWLNALGTWNKKGWRMM